MNSKPLLGSFAKIERSKAQIQDFESKVAAFCRSEPYAIVSEVNTDRSEEIWRFRLTKKIPKELSVVAGEVLHNLRSALDNAVCSIAQQNTGSCKNTYFPFGASADIFENEVLRKTKKLPADAVSMIRALQPYAGGNDLLWQIHDLNRWDKHVSLIQTDLRVVGKMTHLIIWSGDVIAVGPRNGLHMIKATNGNLTQSESSRAPLIERRGDELLLVFGPVDGKVSSHKDVEFLTVTPGTQFETDFKPTFNIAFGKVKCLEGEPAVAILHQLRDLTHRIVLAFERRFFS